ncbi:MAG: M48 family metallopeptidase [Bacilli bacterium]|nr:M48 family metallopeptidase [Bacilli bacterium]
MYFKLHDDLYEVEIVKKISTRNTYIRVKDDLTIYVTTNTFVSDREIEKLLKKSTDSIEKMINQKRKKEEYENNFYFLGKKYDIVYTNDASITLGNGKVFLDKRIDLDKWYKKEASRIFKERFDYNFEKFTRKIPYPTLSIRKMKTRWGVCNTKDYKVTLNLELIKKDISCLDYVINHELAHLIEANHSKKFWAVVEENYPKYKDTRKLLKDY